MIKILAINPGSTSTKIAVYDNENCLYIKNIKHSNEELKDFDNITDQFEFRKNIIVKELKDNNIELETINVIVGRGGLVKPIVSGVYPVNERLIEDLKAGVQGQHASNLGGLIANDLAKEIKGAKAYIADPVVVDELQDVARVSGHSLFTRKSIFHALNHKAIGRKYASSVNKNYEDLNLVIAHLGGGISVGAHLKGKVVDVNNALDGEGPFSPERAGTLPFGQLIDVCFSGKYTQTELMKMFVGKGGFVSHLDTNSAYDVELKAKEGDPKFVLIHDALAYQVGKSIGAMATVLNGNVDAIVLTGGIAYDKDLVKYIEDMTSFIAPIVVFPGEDEMGALALNGLLVATGKVEAKEYN